MEILRNGWLWLACLLLAGCGREAPEVRTGEMEAAAFWVWHRSSALGEGEKRALVAAGVGVLGWQVAELDWKNGRWQVARVAERRVLEVGGGGEVFPVVRITPEAGFLKERRAAVELAGWLADWAGEEEMPGEVQLDFDCPVRLLGTYAEFVKRFSERVAPVRVSVTALASWAGRPGFEKLERVVSSMSPMFYDLEADRAEDVAAGRFRAMADEEAAEWIGRWKKCRVPWRAGLPNFERVSVFAADGKLRGHLRGWAHDALVFHPDLEAVPQGGGVTVFRIARELDFAGTGISPGDILVHRMPGEEELRKMREAAREAGARSLIWFALPGPGLQAAYGAGHLSEETGGVELELRRLPGGEVGLKNAGKADLPARMEGWELVLRAEVAGAFRSAGPGEFPVMRVEGGLPAEVAGEIRLGFSRLRSGEKMVSGPLVERGEGLRWRVEGLEGEWRVVD